MQYFGGKGRLGSRIAAEIAKVRKEGQVYVEPFVGGASVARHVPNRRILADGNRYLIALWESVVSGWDPPAEVTKDDYLAVKAYPEKFEDRYVAWAELCRAFFWWVHSNPAYLKSSHWK